MIFHSLVCVAWKVKPSFEFLDAMMTTDDIDCLKVKVRIQQETWIRINEGD